MQAFGELIPEVGNIIKQIGKALEVKNEADIRKKLNRISNLIKDE